METSYINNKTGGINTSHVKSNNHELNKSTTIYLQGRGAGAHLVSHVRQCQLCDTADIVCCVTQQTLPAV